MGKTDSEKEKVVRIILGVLAYGGGGGGGVLIGTEATEVFFFIKARVSTLFKYNYYEWKLQI
jgi:hypothetical protein